MVLPDDDGWVPGLGVSHAKHFVTSPLLGTRHTSQSQLPVGFLNIDCKLSPPADFDVPIII